MQVTIEGVVNSDVCSAGERHRVEWTEHLRNLVRNGLIRVVEWHHEEVPVVRPAVRAPKQAWVEYLTARGVVFDADAPKAVLIELAG